MEVIKISDSEIQVTTQPETPAPKVVIYNYDFLLAQRLRIILDANNYLSARQKELDEVDSLLAQCEEIGATGQVMPGPLGE